MRKEQKPRVVEELRGLLERAVGLVLVRPQGLKVPELEAIRRNLDQAGASMRVVKNTLFRLALKGTRYEPLVEQLTGPIAAVALGEQVGPALAALTDKRAGTAPEVVGGLLGGRLRSAAEIQALAALPPIEIVAAQLVGALQAPMFNLVRALQWPVVQLVAILQAAAAHKGAA